MDRRVTLQTIADEAGVSKQTVSNAFNRPDQLSAALRTRILETAQRLGYTGPDPSARALSRGSTGVIGVLLTERTPTALADPAAAEFLVGVSEALGDRGQNLLLISGRPDEPDATEGQAVTDAAVDGLIAYSLSPSDPQLLAAQGRALPLVTVDQPEVPNTSFVGAHQHTLTESAARHLTSLGHQRIGVLALRLVRDGRSGPVDAERRAAIEFPVTQKRLDGIASAGCTPTAIWECPGTHTVAAGVDYLLDHDVTAILAMSDVFALAALEQLRQHGKRVPDDISVTGIDDIPAAATVGLTTVAQSHRDKGRLAVDALMNPARHRPHSRLISRTTTARP